VRHFADEFDGDDLKCPEVLRRHGCDAEPELQQQPPLLAEYDMFRHPLLKELWWLCLGVNLLLEHDLLPGCLQHGERIRADPMSLSLREAKSGLSGGASLCRDPSEVW
jgi:hypothetical protein